MRAPLKFGKPKQGQKPWGVRQNRQNLESSTLFYFHFIGLKYLGQFFKG
jgi:hypothetical protein